MAATSFTTGSSSYVRERHVTRIHRYHWPAIQLNVWMLIMLAASCCLIGICAVQMEVQHHLRLYTPWYFPYWITVSSLTIAFIALLLWLISQRRLLPSIVILGAFMFFVLWLVGLIVVSIEMWSSDGSVSSNCDRLVFGNAPAGNNVQTLAWLQQKSICEFPPDACGEGSGWKKADWLAD